jgi:hypothetical protein
VCLCLWRCHCPLSDFSASDAPSPGLRWAQRSIYCPHVERLVRHLVVIVSFSGAGELPSCQSKTSPGDVTSTAIYISTALLCILHVIPRRALPTTHSVCPHNRQSAETPRAPAPKPGPRCLLEAFVLYKYTEYNIQSTYAAYCTQPGRQRGNWRSETRGCVLHDDAARAAVLRSYNTPLPRYLLSSSRPVCRTQCPITGERQGTYDGVLAHSRRGWAAQNNVVCPCSCRRR